VADERDAVWVESDRTPQGIYRATIHPTPDVSIPLGHAQATVYAEAVVLVCEYADYDAAVIAQLTALGISVEQAAEQVAEMRKQRRVPPRAATAPLVFTPVVSASTGRPYVHVYLRGKALTQWSTDDARGHAMHVLSVAVAATLDRRYHEHLTRVVGLTAEQAATTVHNLRGHRHANGGLPEATDA